MLYVRRRWQLGTRSKQGRVAVALEKSHADRWALERWRWQLGPENGTKYELPPHSIVFLWCLLDSKLLKCFTFDLVDFYSFQSTMTISLSLGNELTTWEFLQICDKMLIVTCFPLHYNRSLLYSRLSLLAAIQFSWGHQNIKGSDIERLGRETERGLHRCRNKALA